MRSMFFVILTMVVGNAAGAAEQCYVSMKASCLSEVDVHFSYRPIRTKPGYCRRCETDGSGNFQFAPQPVRCPECLPPEGASDLEAQAE